MIAIDACPICRAPASGSVCVHRRSADAVYRCGACGSLFASPRPEGHELDDLYRREYYGSEASDPSRAASQQTGASLHRVVLRALAQRYPQVIRPGAKVLDFGCGRGYFLKEAQALGLQATGIEISPEAAQFARTQLDAAGRDSRRAASEVDAAGSDSCRAASEVGSIVHTGDESLLASKPEAFPRGGFDLVHCSQVIEHLLEPRKVLAMLAQRLRPGGLLCLAYPNLGCWRYRLEGARWFNMANPTHLNFPALSGMKRMLGELGMVSVRRMVYWGGREGVRGPAAALQYLVRLLNIGSDVRLLASARVQAT